MRRFPSRPPHVRWSSVWLPVVCLLLIGLPLLQQPGKLVGDTKLDLATDPGRFLGGALHLWDAGSSFGQLGDQAYGYLFPTGPFFLVGHSLQLPGWVVQRLWQGSLLAVAFVGVYWLAGRFGIGSRPLRALGGLAYALSPLLLTHVGPLSGAALPEAMAPMVLAPLVGDDALARPRRAAALSGLALLFAGGVNGAGTLALLVLPAVWVVTRPPGRVRRRLAGWWVLAVVLASAWWVLPLLVFGTYSPPFEAWVESAPVTTSVTGLFGVLTGTDDWVAHLTSPVGPVWVAGWDLATSVVCLLDAALLAAVGLLGMLREDLPHRRYLVTVLLLGVAIVTFGHIGPGAWPFAGAERRALDGALAVFRNLAKFDLVLRIPLTLAAVHLADRVRLSELSFARWRLRSLSPAAAVAVIALAGVALPIWAGDLEPAGAFRAVPSWWHQTAAYLQAHDTDRGTALLLPASSHGEYAWGIPQDEPLQSLARTPWAVRSVAPLGGAGEARLLDAVDRQIETGQGSSALAAFLARAGVSYLVVRNDLQLQRDPVTSPAAVAAALRSSPGIELVASFGRTYGRDPQRPFISADGLGTALPAVQIYRVGLAAPQITTMPTATTLRVAGAVESLLPLLSAGVLHPGQATVMADTPAARSGAAAADPLVVTDGNRHAETDFGRVTQTQSATLLPGQPWSQQRQGHDYDADPGLAAHTTARVYGVRAVHASSSAASAGAFWYFNQADGPAAAFDRNPLTSWVSGGPTAVGEWNELDFSKPQRLTTARVVAPAVGGAGPPVTQIRITTATGSETAAVSTAPVTLRLPPGPTRWVRFTATAVQGGGPGADAALEVAVHGVPAVTTSLVPPADGRPAGGVDPTFAFTGQAGDDGCLHGVSPARATVCSILNVEPSEDGAGIDRTFAVPATASYRLRLQGLLTGVGDDDVAARDTRGLRVSVSSTRIDDPSDGSLALVDGDPATGWLPAPGDLAPAVDVTFDSVRTVSAVTVTTSPQLPASAPAKVAVSNGRYTQRATVVGGVAKLPRPVTGGFLRIRFPGPHLAYDQNGSQLQRLPVGLNELGFRFKSGRASRPSPVLAPGAAVVVPCGSGPTLRLDGRALRTQVRTTVGDATAGRPAVIRPCGPHGTARLTAGVHRVRIATTGTVIPTAVTLTPVDAVPTVISPAPPRAVRTVAWQADRRLYDVAAGPQAWLVLQQNSNAGWHASLAGRALQPAVVDGWKQAFLLPAGAGGRVELRFTPDHGYRIALLIGAVLVGLLLIWWLLVVRRRGDVSVPVDGRPVEPTRARWLAFVVVTGLLVLAAGGEYAAAALAVGFVALALAERVAPRHVTAVLSGLVIAGLAAAAGMAAASPLGGAPGALSALAQVGCAITLSSVAVAAWRHGRPRVVRSDQLACASE